jgi:hypothetical protein
MRFAKQFSNQFLNIALSTGRGCQGALIGFPKSIEELFGKRRNNEAIMTILFAKLSLSEVDFDETGVVKRCLLERKKKPSH